VRKSYVTRRTLPPRSNVSCLTGGAVGAVERETSHHRRTAADESQIFFASTLACGTVDFDGHIFFRKTVPTVPEKALM
jgi:hypothetical protein